MLAADAVITMAENMRLSELCEELRGRRAGNWKSAGEEQLLGLTLDSREVQGGFAFFAVRGEKEDGHDYVRDAAGRGAAAVIVEKETPEVEVPQIVVRDTRRAAARAGALHYRRPSERMKVIGVTGTNGKTTVAYLIRSIFREAGERVGLLGTIEYDLVGRSVRAKTTTPDPISIQAQLREMLEAGAIGAVMEVSSHALVQERVSEVRFCAGVFTNLGRDHLDYHRTIESYRDAKARLFEMLEPGAIAVLNAEDGASKELKRRTEAKVCLYGLDHGELMAEVRETNLGGSKYELLWEGKRHPVKSRLVGSWNVMNVLGAARTGLALGLGMGEVVGGVERFEGVPGRLEPIEGAKGFHVFVDYAHTPEALEAVLSSLKPMVKGRLIVVFGCGGDRDRGKRVVMGSVAERWADVTWLTADNSRSEDTRAIIAEIEKGMRTKRKYSVEPDRASAINASIAAARKGDTVVIAGKGHEDYQILGSRRLHFDDREVAREAISRKPGS